MAVATFEGLPPGSTTAAAAGFDFITGPASGGVTVIDTNPYRGSRCLQFLTGTPGAICYAERSTSVTGTPTGQIYGRVRVRLPVLPPDAPGMRVMVFADTAGAFLAEARIINSGRLQLRDGAGTVLAASTTAITAGQWVDVGLAILVTSATVGQAQLAVFGGDGGIAETLTSTATLNTLGAGGAVRCQVGAIRSGLPGFAVVVDDVDFSRTGWPAVASAATLQAGPWSGAVTDTGFTAVYRLSGASSARLLVSTTADLTAPVASRPARPDADGLVRLTIAGLAPDTGYHYGVEADGQLLSTGHGEARTFPPAGMPASFSLWFGSCQWTVPADQTYAAILNQTGPHGRALMGIHMGDLNYRDWGPTSTAADILAQHMTSLGSASMAPHLAKIPFNYCWDNHDWGGDTSDRTAAAGPLVATAYRQVFATYPLPAGNGRGGYHSWTIGRIRFIQLDTRSYRDPQTDPDGPGKTMLGAEQKQWFKDRLLDPEPVKIICGNMYWRHDNPASGRWGSYGTEFAELNTFIAAHQVRAYVIFGDRHALCADDGTAPGAYGMPQAGGAPIQQGSVAAGEPWSAGYYHQAPATIQGYGWLDITDTGTTITVDYQGITSLDGQTRVAMTTEFEVVAAALADLWGVHL
ncbi:alkaline phosphatase D family protein [Actinoplanes sp. NPDC026623]|uniref:alkaline phosphatase D family protein n=1 Tax=Actinoplanes sp. NPDC026623 TaxID=3155610 RepID=UPI0033EF1662